MINRENCHSPTFDEAELRLSARSLSDSENIDCLDLIKGHEKRNMKLFVSIKIK